MGELDDGHARILAAPPPRRRVRALAAPAAVLLAAAVLVSCSNDDADSSSAPVEAPAQTAAAAADDGDVGGGLTAGESEDADGSTAAPATQAADRSVIHTAAMTVTVDDVDAASTAVSRIATAAGGSVFAADVSLEPPAFAIVTVKVPPEALDPALAQVAELGRVTERTQTAEDVTAQVVDLDARIASAEASLDRVRSFLARADDVADLALLEAELTSRETTLEQLRAQQRVLSEQVDLATLTVTLVESGVTRSVSLVGLVETEPPGVIDAFVSGLAVLGAGIWWAVIVIAAVLPFLVVAAGIALLIIWLVRRPRRQRDPDA